jgi:hypothetical protein
MALLILLYFLFAGLVMSIYALVNGSEFPFSECADKEESCKMILIYTFWPLYLLYIFTKGVIWFFKHLWIALVYFFKKYFKKK